MRRVQAGLLCAVAVVLAVAPVVRVSATATPRVGPAPVPAATYRSPTDPLRVLRPFEPPPTPYAAGHRGVDLATTTGTPVLAARAGVVRFAGSVAGRGVVVLAHSDGITTEYEPVHPQVRVGQAVIVGTVIATVLGRHGTLAAGACLHWGARRGGQYFDPLTLLRRLGPVRLLPWTGDP
ncbi:MAG: M23 family metallopeptidase [Jatrophihabitans sp.]